MAKVTVERRKNPRFNMYRMGHILYGDKKIICVFVNISKEGICFFTKPDMHIEGEFEFEFTDDDGTEIRGKAKPIFKSESFESDVYGNKILFIAPYNYIDKYIQND